MTDTEEMWRAVPGYEGYYEASNHGRARSLDRTLSTPRGDRRFRGRVLVSALTSQGRPIVSLSRDGASHTLQLSVLVARTWLGEKADGQVVCHLDDNPLNNRTSNLYYGTASQNMQDRIRNGNNPKLNKSHCPRGHLLQAPNLGNPYSNRPERVCLSCRRARSRCKFYRQTGRDIPFGPIADEIYASLPMT